MTNYTSVKIDTNSEFVIEDGKFITVTGNDETLQRVMIRLKVFLNEWFLDPSNGLDFFGQIAGKKKGSTSPRKEIEQRILGTEGIKNITSYSEQINSTTGKWKFSIGVSFDDGETGEVNI